MAKKKSPQVVVYLMRHRKDLVQYYSNLKGMSESAFMNMCFSYWQEKHEAKKG